MPVTTAERRMRVAQQLRLVIRHLTRSDIDLVNMPPTPQQVIRDFVVQAKAIAKQYDPSNERNA
jgi:ribosome maturation protein Sdo1